MRPSRRAKFHDPAWLTWLKGFPDYGERGHVPSIRFRDAVKAHIHNAGTLAAPSDSDFQVLSSELGRHFREIRRILRTGVDGGILAAFTGLVGIVGDFLILPGFSYALNSLAALLIFGGGAASYSARQEVLFLAEAERLTGDWLNLL